MQPNSLTFVVTVGAAMVALIIITVRMWPRPRLRKTRTISLLIVCQLLTLLFGAGIVNWQNGFYSTWGSLLGTQEAVQAAPPPVSPGAKPTGIAYQGIPDFDTLKAQWQAAGGKGSIIVPVTLTGNTTQYALPANIYLPAAYFTDDGATLYPVMEYLAGMPGTADQWLFGMNLQKLLDDAIESNTLRPVIAILATANAVPDVDTECLDLPDGSKTMTYLTRDVPWAVSQALRAQPGGWIAAGFSSAGYCAMNFAFQFPGQYRGAINLSGYSTPFSDTTLFTDERTANINSPYWLLANHAAKSVPLFLGASSIDDEDKAEMDKILSVLPEYPKPGVAWVDNGGHNAATWAALSIAAWPWVEQQFATPKDHSREVPRPGEPSATPTTKPQSPTP